MTATDADRVDASNIDQLRAWDGEEGAYWAIHADRFDRSLAAYRGRFLEAADVGAREHVVDVGCGTGETTLDAALAARSGSALGVDLSSAMLDVARRRAARAAVDNVAFEQADAQVHPFEPAAFDIAISRTGAMFFGDLVAAFTNIARALRNDGRLVLLTWQSMDTNEWIRAFTTALAAGRPLPTPAPDARGPFALSDPSRVRTVLTAAGFTDVALEAVSRPMWVGVDAADAHEFILGLMGWMLEGLDDAGRARARDALWTAMAAHETAAGVVYGSGAWIIRARRG